MILQAEAVFAQLVKKCVLVVFCALWQVSSDLCACGHFTGHVTWKGTLRGVCGCRFHRQLHISYVLPVAIQCGIGHIGQWWEGKGRLPWCFTVHLGKGCARVVV